MANCVSWCLRMARGFSRLSQNGQEDVWTVGTKKGPSVIEDISERPGANIQYCTTRQRIEELFEKGQ